MAQQVNVKFVDDLDGSDAAATVSFGLDGKTYEIDLSDDNAAKLRDSLAVFVSAARKSGGSATTRSRRTQKMTAGSGRRPQPLDREQTAAIRAHARIAAAAPRPGADRRDPGMGPTERSPGLRPRPHLQDRLRRLPGRSLIQTQRGGRSGLRPSSYVRCGWGEFIPPTPVICE